MIKYLIREGQKRKIRLEGPGEYRIELAGAGAEVDVSGVFVGKGRDDVGVKVEVVHKVGYTRATVALKGAGYGKSRLRFEGRVVVMRDCPGVSSFLSERILLLSDKARAEAVPDLEIESDDVKCSHAATVGRIPEEQIFYLMSRGIGRRKAGELVVEGFLLR